MAGKKDSKPAPVLVAGDFYREEWSALPLQPSIAEGLAKIEKTASGLETVTRLLSRQSLAHINDEMRGSHQARESLNRYDQGGLEDAAQSLAETIRADLAELRERAAQSAGLTYERLCRSGPKHRR